MSIGTGWRRDEAAPVLVPSQGLQRAVFSVVDITAPLCKTCRGMLQHFQPGKSGYSYEGDHYRSSKELLVAVASGCGICIRIKVNFGDDSSLYKFFYEGNCLNYEVRPSGITVLGPQGFFLGLDAHTMKHQHWLEFDNLTCSYTGAQSVLRRAKAWLSTCLHNHQLCSRSSDPLYSPPRLLHIESTKVRLLDSSAQCSRSPYATVSYCWGRNPTHLKLTAQNISILQDGVDLCLLAKTFQDAIMTCLALGIHFLWIDSLCILQAGPGHEADWQWHLTEMCAIYENCTINILADYSDHAQGGCFVYRHVDHVKPCIIHTTTSEVPEHTALVDISYRTRISANGPSRRRGWCYQERLLSPRVLRFGSDQISWECRDLCACESFPSGIPRTSLDESSSVILPAYSELDDLQWDSIINTYSPTGLTNPQDKLPAIAGVAERVASAKGTSYVAGFMKNSLPTALVWGRGSVWYLTRVMNPYRAPTWSWVSCDGIVRGLYRAFYQHVESLCIIEAIYLDHVNPKYPYGQLRGGSITLTSSTLEILGLGKEDEYTDVHGFCLLPEGVRAAYSGSDVRSVKVNFDENPMQQPRTALSFLIICETYRSNSPNGYALHGLVLTQAQNASGAKLWMRIGAFCVYGLEKVNRALIQNKPTTTFTII